MDSNNKTAEITNLKSKIDLLKLETGAEFIEKEENGTIITAVMLPDLDNTINDADTRFQSYSLNLLNNIKSSDEYFDREFVSSSNGTLIAEIDKSANLVLYYESGSYYPGYPHHTIATDVRDCEFVFVGNGGGPSLYFVDKDGHIGATEQLSIDLSNHAPEVTTNIVNLQNIVSISNYSNAAGNFVEYVDIDGNIKR